MISIHSVLADYINIITMIQIKFDSIQGPTINMKYDIICLFNTISHLTLQHEG